MQRGEDKVLKQAALAAGKLIKAAEPTKGLVQKEGRGNPVTDADLASEKLIIELIRQNFPDDDILAEETADTITDPLNRSHLWVIDPIDATSNFSHGRNFSSVSIGYVENGVLMGGVIYNPFSDELFMAERGHGAFLGDQKLQVSQLKDMGKGSIATDNSAFPAGTKRNLETLLKLPETPWVMMRGSATLVMCDVAAGRIDLYFHTFLKPWDNAAGFLIAEEAGAKLTDLEGKPVDFMSSDVVMGNPTLVDQFLKATL